MDRTRERLEPVRARLESARKKTRPRKYDVLDVLAAVLYLLEHRAPWRAIPPQYPPWRSVHEYFHQWTAPVAGGPTLLERVLAELGENEAITYLHELLTQRAHAQSDRWADRRQD